MVLKKKSKSINQTKIRNSSTKKKTSPAKTPIINKISENNYYTIKGYTTLFAIISLLIIDRITKIGAIKLNNNTIDLGIIEFTYTVNTGAGFSIFNNMNLFLTITTIIIAIALIYFYNNASINNKTFVKIPKFSFITIISGTIGNILDRIFHGGVIDFINFKFWPIFNVSDSLIFIGVVYWIIILIREK